MKKNNKKVSVKRGERNERKLFCLLYTQSNFKALNILTK
jgi:hypothetical protein